MSDFSKQRLEKDTCMCNAILCSYVGFTSNFGCRFQEECLCFRRRCCLDPDAQPLTCGISTVEEVHRPNQPDLICTLGCKCYEVSLIYPRTCYGAGQHALCMKSGAAVPFHEDYLQEPVCAYYCISCAPKCGCAEAPPKCLALEHMMKHSILPTEAPAMIVEMDRGYRDHVEPEKHIEVVAERVHDIREIN